MKKWRFVLLLVALLCTVSEVRAADIQLAEVTDVTEYVTLRNKPDKKGKALKKIPLGAVVTVLSEPENDFTQVAYQGENGFVLEKYLKRQRKMEGELLSMDSALTIHLNLYLTQFTSQGFARDTAFLRDECTDREMIDAAIGTLVYTEKAEAEKDGQGVRIPGKEVYEAAGRLFGREISDMQSGSYPYVDGYYLVNSPSGRTEGGFASVRAAEDLHDGLLFVWFEIFAEGQKWTPEGVCMFSVESARTNYPNSLGYQGMALIDTGNDLTDRSRWQIIQYQVFNK